MTEQEIQDKTADWFLRLVGRILKEESNNGECKPLEV